MKNPDLSRSLNLRRITVIQLRIKLNICRSTLNISERLSVSVYLYVVYHAPVIRVHKHDDKQNIDKYWHLEGYLHTATNMLAGDLSTCGLSIN